MAQSMPSGSGSPADGQAARISAGAIASLSGVAVLLIFMLQNPEDVTLDFLFWSFTWPLWLFSLLMALFGAMVWFGAGVIRRRQRRKERRGRLTTPRRLDAERARVASG